MKPTAFKIPLQTEVEMYIREKKRWPDDFVKYYADKFWNHYQASGWKLSNGNRIKDWKACFNSQWQVPKYKEDIEKLNGLSAKNGFAVVQKGQAKEIAELDNLLQIYSKHPTSIRFVEFGKWYEYLKVNRLMRVFTRGEVEELQNIYQSDNEKCRCACVQITFNDYVKGGITFNHIMEIRQKL